MENYQITLGGDGSETAALGEIVGRAFPRDEIADAVETIVGVYLERRDDGERFLETYRRVGPVPFRERLYGAH